MKKLLSLLVILLTSLQLSAIEIGDTAPDFAVKAADGKVYKLSDFKGKTVVLEATNLLCPFVKKFYNIGDMQALQNKSMKEGMVWLMVCASNKGKLGYFEADEINRRLAKWKATPTAYLMDVKGEIGRAYGMKTTPHMYVISPEGKLVYQGAIDSIGSGKSTDVPKATNYVKQALAELKLGQKISVPKTIPYGCKVHY